MLSHAANHAGDDAYDLLLDTDEVLDNPLLGPLVRGALRVAAPNLDPAEVNSKPAISGYLHLQ